MDSQGCSPGENGRFEQILSQFFLKTLHIILDSRIPSIRPYSRSGQVQKSDKWFNLALGARPAALDNLNFWQRNIMEPMVIDIIVVRETPNSSPDQNSRITSGLGMFVETVIERWVVQYDHFRTMGSQISDAVYKKIYKKCIILFRSLHSMMRLLPAYKAFRKLFSSTQSCDFDINYKVSSFGAPFSRAEEESMKCYSFNHVDVQHGRLSVSVMYRESLSDLNLEISALFPPQIITDYVGSPATDPLRSFPLVERVDYATSFPFRGKQKPPSSPSQRPHSWTSGLHRGAHLARNQPIGGSPPAYCTPTSPYDLSSSPTDMLQYGHRMQSYRLPTQQKIIGSDDYQLSPPFSPSPSPSPPAYLSGGNIRDHSETAPVSIPHSMLGRSPRYLSPNLSDPNRHSLPPLSPRNTRHDSSSQESPSGTRSFRKSESLRTGESNSGITNYYYGHKVSRDGKDDSGRFSGLLSSSGSPRIGFSRSSSRLSFQDDLDDCDFSCPFVVDDVDTPPDFHAGHSQNVDGRKGSEMSSQQASRKSQDAAVGALVHMLRTAPPLRQDSTSCYSSLGEEVGSGSGVLSTRKTSDALEELRSYKQLKDLLLSKSGSPLLPKDEEES